MNRRARKKQKLQARGTWRPASHRHVDNLRRSHERFIVSLECYSGEPIDRTAAPFSLAALIRREP